MRAAVLLKQICVLPIDPDPSNTAVMFDKVVCRSLLENRAVADPLASFAIANAAIFPVTDVEWVGCEAMKVLSALMSANGLTDYSWNTHPDWKNGR